MSAKADTSVNLNTMILTALIAVLGFFGNRLVEGQDVAAKLLAAHEVKLSDMDRSISELQSDAKDTIHRPEYERFKNQVQARIGISQLDNAHPSAVNSSAHNN